MEKKRTVSVLVRLTPEVAELLSQEAHSVGWSRTHLATRILNQWADRISDHRGALGFIVRLD